MWRRRSSQQIKHETESEAGTGIEKQRTQHQSISYILYPLISAHLKSQSDWKSEIFGIGIGDSSVIEHSS